jgi:hypothetical protein
MLVCIRTWVSDPRSGSAHSQVNAEDEQVDDNADSKLTTPASVYSQAHG